ncbi:MAG: CoA ester lyase [Burkholderiales bacterium]|nr:CoA ester lyase [Burkholderiales bacterium]
MKDIGLLRSWLFVAGADAAAHEAATRSGADVLIQDLEDFTPPERRPAARAASAALLGAWRAAGSLTAVRVNRLEGEGLVDLDDAVAARPDFIAYPKAAGAEDMRALDLEVTLRERRLGLPAGGILLLPVCETARGVVFLGEIAAASPRVRCALLGAEDLAADLMAERGRDADELDHARRRFVLECRAFGVEPIDAPYTFADAEGAVAETRRSRRLGYRCKSLVRPDHAAPINGALTPTTEECMRARRLIEAFRAARARGEDRALVDGLWVELPMMLTAQRLLERADVLRTPG